LGIPNPYKIIHSFNTPSYKEKEFTLKANITKAFDTVEWPFVMECLYAINVPDKLIKFIKSLLQDSKLTMVVNGQGEGFFSPTRGLRQGCPMSSYFFILAMEFLTKRLDKAVQK
jgi:Reverse transcriptase (RNA-dependent DNA polymerase)